MIQSNILVNTCQVCKKLKIKYFTKQGKKLRDMVKEKKGRCECK